MENKTKTTSPKGGKRGCLCKDKETYSKECCNGELQEQGIGNTKNQSTSTITRISNGVTTVTTR